MLPEIPWPGEGKGREEGSTNWEVSGLLHWLYRVLMMLLDV